MIYSKNVSFPYPVYTNDSIEYRDPYFNFDITEIIEGEENYLLSLEINLESKFIKGLLDNDYASMLLVIKSNTSNYFEIKMESKEFKLRKDKVNLYNSQIQLLVITKNTINFSENRELNDFFDEYLNEIIVKKNSLIAFSNIQAYKKPDKNSLRLFSYRIDSHQIEDFKVNIRPDIIELLFNDERIIFNNKYRNLLNMYFYNGISLAIINIFSTWLDNNQEVNLESYVRDKDIDLRLEDSLENKLIELMLDKGIDLVSFDNLDSIIHRISNGLVGKFVKEIEILSKYSGG